MRDGRYLVGTASATYPTNRQASSARVRSLPTYGSARVQRQLILVRATRQIAN